MIPYGHQCINETDVESVVAVLRSDWLTQGPAVERFEQAVATSCGALHACAANSATSALHLACLGMGLGPGDLLWTVPNTFVASANCGLLCGADVDFVDIDPRTYCLDPVALEERLMVAERTGRLPDLLVAVDFGGQPCDYQALGALKARYGFALLEDASHAIGAMDNGRKVGALPEADATIFSFHPVKIVTSGEGGMILTGNSALDQRVRELRSHGIVRERSRLNDQAQGAWYYEQQNLGFNYRITDLQAALGASQMERLEGFLTQRRRLASRYDNLIKDMPLRMPSNRPGASSAHHLYPILLEDESTRRCVFDALREAGIGVQVHYLPVHLHPYYRKLGFRPGTFPIAEDYGRRTVSLPLFPALTDAEQDTVVASLGEALRDVSYHFNRHHNEKTR